MKAFGVKVLVAALGICLVGAPVDAAYTVTIVNPVETSVPYSNPFSLTVSGVFGYDYPCVLMTCIPHHIDVDLYLGGDGRHAIDNTFPMSHPGVTNVGFGSGDFSFDYDEIEFNEDEEGRANLIVTTSTQLGAPLGQDDVYLELEY